MWTAAVATHTQTPRRGAGTTHAQHVSDDGLKLTVTRMSDGQRLVVGASTAGYTSPYI